MAIQISTRNLVRVRRRIAPKIVQPIRIRSNWLIREDTRKCLECHGIPRITLRGNGKLAGFYSVNVPYPHREGCRNK